MVSGCFQVEVFLGIKKKCVGVFCACVIALSSKCGSFCVCVCVCKNENKSSRRAYRGIHEAPFESADQNVPCSVIRVQRGLVTMSSTDRHPR